MMSGGKVIYLNGEAMELRLPGGSLDDLLRGNYIYESVNCVGNRPLHLRMHLDFAADSYNALYAYRPALDYGQILEHIQRLLYLNGASLSGNIATIYLLPPEDFVFADNPAPSVIIAYERTVMYGTGYTLNTLRPRAMVATYDIPFESRHTSISLTSAQYMDKFAARRNANIAIRSTRNGSIVSSGDFPVFAVREGRIIVPPLSNGTQGSVERHLMTEACRMNGMETEEREISFAELPETDEIIIFKNTGIVSPLCIDSLYFTNLAAVRLEKSLPRITEAGLDG